MSTTKKILFYFLILFSMLKNNAQTVTKISKPNFAIAIHGGASNIVKKNLTPEQELQYKKKMTEALQLGYDMLAKGDSGVNVVEAVIKVLEDSPLFNAGKGSVFTNDGKNEMDAAIMDGKTLKAGAVAGLRTIKNPISLAKKVMEDSKFVFLSSKGAEKFAKEHSIEIVDTSYFYTQERWDDLLRIKDTSKLKSRASDTSGALTPKGKFDKYGTVGCVVLDKYGNLAAGTSTGGTVNKKYNRIGDSPLIGAGTYAKNSTCAISCTGHGEDFIRLVAAHDVSSLMEYKKLSLELATNDVILKKLNAINGRGGMIGIDSKGNISMKFNTSGMFRGFADKNGKIKVFIYKED